MTWVESSCDLQQSDSHCVRCKTFKDKATERNKARCVANDLHMNASGHLNVRVGDGSREEIVKNLELRR